MYTIEIVNGKMFLILDKLEGVPDQLKSIITPRMELKGNEVELENINITIKSNIIVIQIKSKVETFIEKAIPKTVQTTLIYPFKDDCLLHTIKAEGKNVKEINFFPSSILKDYPICNKMLVLVKSGLTIIRKQIQMNKEGLYICFTDSEIKSLGNDVKFEFYKYILHDGRKLGKNRQSFMSDEVINVVCLSKLEGNSSYNVTGSYNRSVKDEIKQHREMQ